MHLRSAYSVSWKASSAARGAALRLGLADAVQPGLQHQLLAGGRPRPRCCRPARRSRSGGAPRPAPGAGRRRRWWPRRRPARSAWRASAAWWSCRRRWGRGSRRSRPRRRRGRRRAPPRPSAARAGSERLPQPRCLDHFYSLVVPRRCERLTRYGAMRSSLIMSRPVNVDLTRAVEPSRPCDQPASIVLRTGRRSPDSTRSAIRSHQAISASTARCQLEHPGHVDRLRRRIQSLSSDARSRSTAVRSMRARLRSAAAASSRGRAGRKRERRHERVDRLIKLPPVLAQQLLELGLALGGHLVRGPRRAGADLLGRHLAQQALPRSACAARGRSSRAGCWPTCRRSSSAAHGARRSRAPAASTGPGRGSSCASSTRAKRNSQI